MKSRVCYLLHAVLGERAAAPLAARIGWTMPRVRAGVVRPERTPSDEPNEDPVPATLRAAPLESGEHLSLAEHCLEHGILDLAFAQARSAGFLGADSGRCRAIAEEVVSRRRPLEDWNHNQHFRLTSLARKLVALAQGERASVLDVGGGYGALAQFLPDDWDYCLAEPTTNGIDGTDLPFDHESFDFVVSCHVLEHVPESRRFEFLDNLLARCRKAVLLLNPIDVPGGRSRERVELVVDVTDADWAREHLECGLPSVASVKSFADARDVPFEYSANGSAWMSMALVFADHFAALAGRTSELAPVHRFFNQLSPEQLDSTSSPTAGMFVLRKRVGSD